MTAPRSLEGRRLLVTRREEQAGDLVAALRERGAEVRLLPLIDVQPPSDPGPLDAALRQLEAYQWVVFTSANAVEALARRVAALGLAPSTLPSLASVGPATTAAVKAAFPSVRRVLEPEASYRAEGLVAAFAAGAAPGARALLPQSDRARPTVAEGLRRLGLAVDAVVAYRTVTPAGVADALRRICAGGLDLAVLASPSAAEALVATGGPVPPVAVIGPVTEAAARSAGLEVRVVAEPSTAEGLVAALERHFRPPASPARYKP